MFFNPIITLIPALATLIAASPAASRDLGADTGHNGSISTPVDSNALVPQIDDDFRPAQLEKHRTGYLTAEVLADLPKVIYLGHIHAAIMDENSVTFWLYVAWVHGDNVCKQSTQLAQDPNQPCGKTFCLQGSCNFKIEGCGGSTRTLKYGSLTYAKCYKHYYSEGTCTGATWHGSAAQDWVCDPTYKG